MSGIFKTTGILGQALDYHLRRQNVLASNVANVDTPGFKALELTREQPGETDFTLALRRTHKTHMGPGEGGAAPVLEADTEAVVQPGGDGNNVSLDREMAKVATNEMRYETVTRITRTHMGWLRYAAMDATQG